ncbi:uncharacterized protein LOC115725598 isoform X2 [Cannabis sativa]|uniref:uncharacterized protein LOC115725598 isoform X2 n=1 Tax=Cannabis sativa TaxID=3483 RepID=UPI0029C9FA31|nr:uncharacterized protein LOC115725598 isoform X2 [Cannabis sativa]
MGSGNYYKLRRIILEFFHGSSSSSSVWMQRKSPERMIGRYGYSYQGLKLFSSTNRDWTTFGTMNKEIKVHPVIKAPIPAASNSQSYSFFPYWGRWFLGSLVTFLPFSYDKWVKLRALEGRAEMVVEEVENVAEMVEKVALVAEKMSSEVGDELPENGTLKKTAMLVERLSHKAAQEAHLTKQFIHKVDELKEDLEKLETLIEPHPLLKPKNESKGH